jgi:hypothetical protein
MLGRSCHGGSTNDLDHPICVSHQRGNSSIVLGTIQLRCSTMYILRELQNALTCQPGLFGGYCAVQACNADTDCRTGSICDFGVCQNTCTRNTDCDPGQICVRGDEGRKICVPRPIVGGGGGHGGPPPHYYTEGGICGTIRLGGALSGPVKHLGCAPGLQCVGAFATGTGTCQRPPS